MNITDLTIGQFNQLKDMFSCTSTNNVNHPFIGKYVIARCYSAGVHAGELISVDGENVILKDSRRLWNWRASDGIALSGLAQNGLKDGKLDSVNPEIYLTGVCELIPCAAGVKETIHGKK